jgi:hypothetical protein
MTTAVDQCGAERVVAQLFQVEQRVVVIIRVRLRPVAMLLGDLLERAGYDPDVDASRVDRPPLIGAAIAGMVAPFIEHVAEQTRDRRFVTTAVDRQQMLT